MSNPNSRRMAWRPLAAVLVFGVGASVTAASDEGRLIDQVWSGHPVSFALLAHDGRVFVAYYDAERRLTVASSAMGRDSGGEAWTYVRPEGVWLPARGRMSNVTDWDSHNYLALAIDRDGRLHLSGNMHVDPLLYWRTRAPLDITTLTRIDHMTGERERNCTYPVFFHDAAGRLLFRYRDGGSGRGSDLYNAYDPATNTWRRLLDVPLLDGEGERNAYASAPTLGPDGRFHLVWMWRDTPDCATNNHLSYARSEDLVHWENARGEPIPLPITLARGEVIDAAQPGEGLINTTFALGFDARRQPVVVYHRYDKAGRSQLFAARPGSDGWTPRAITAWDWRWQFSGGGSIVVEVKVGAPRAVDGDVLEVPFTSHRAGDGRVRFDLRAEVPGEVISAAPTPLPAEWMRPRSGYPEMEVKLKLVRVGGKTYVLRWEHLPSNRDRPRDVLPPPTELRLFEIEDAAGVYLEQIGS